MRLWTKACPHNTVFEQTTTSLSAGRERGPTEKGEGERNCPFTIWKGQIIEEEWSEGKRAGEECSSYSGMLSTLWKDLQDQLCESKWLRTRGKQTFLHRSHKVLCIWLVLKEGLKQADLNNSKTSPLSPLFGRYFKLLVYLTEMWVKPSVSVFVLSHRGAAVIYDLSAESQKQESAWSLIRTAVSEMKWGINNDILCTPFFFSSTIHDYMVTADDRGT